MSKVKNDLISYAPSSNQGGEAIINVINNELSDDDARKCLKYLVELEESDHPHTIKEIGFDDNNYLYIKAGTGITFMN